MRETYRRMWVFVVVFSSLSVLHAESPQIAKAIHTKSSVFAVDSHLAEEVSIVSQDSRIDANKIFIARTVFKNESSEDIDIHVQTIFKNPKGMTIEVSPTKTISLKPHQEKPYISVSAKKDVQKFLVYLKPYAPQIAQLPSNLLLEVKKEEERW